MGKVNHNFQILQTIVKCLNKTQGRDKICKFLQYFCLLLSCKFKDDDYYSLQFQTLFQSIKDARKVFRLFKSLIQYQKLIKILLDDDDNWLKIFRVVGQVFFFFYWFFDNICIACKIKILKGNYMKYHTIASIFWLLSLLLSIPVLYISYRSNPHSSKPNIQLLDMIKYCFDLLPATRDSKILQKLIKKNINAEFASLGGMVSASITTYEILKESS